MNRGADAGHAFKEWLRQSAKMMMVGSLLSHTVILIFGHINIYMPVILIYEYIIIFDK